MTKKALSALCTHELSFRDALLSELSRRQAVNQRYSLRAFAKFLNLSPGYLSNVLGGRKTFSKKKAQHVAKCLGYADGQSDEFWNLVQHEKLNTSEILPGAKTVRLDQFHAIADWYHYAILDLTTVQGFRSDVDWIAQRLDLDVFDVSSAIDRLLRLGLLKKSASGKLKKSNRHIETVADLPSPALRLHHAQLIERAKAALENRPVDEREISGLTLSFDPELLPLAKTEIRKFKKRMARLLTQGKPQSVYQLNIQFFELTQKESRK